MAAAAGLLWALSFPRPGIAGFGWLVPGLILVTSLGTTPKLCFKLGYIAGLVYHLVALSWLLWIPVNKLFPLAGLIALSAYLALYPALWVWLCWKLFPGEISRTNLRSGFSDLFQVGWSQRACWALLCAALWVGGEIIQGRLLSGFPWNLLGASQYRVLPLIQVASWIGVYGVSFLMVWLSVALALAFARLIQQPKDRRSWFTEAMLPFLIVVSVISLGTRKILQPAEPRSSIRIALIQPSIPQRMIWDVEESEERFRQLLALSRQALEAKPDLLVWPEAAVPGFFRYHSNVYIPITDLARQHQVWVILGADDAARRQGQPDSYDVFNSSFLVSPAGEVVADYRKQRLVIFGEYIPLGRYFPILERLTGMGSFTPGDGPVSFYLAGLDVKTSLLICFEDVFPHVTRRAAGPDLDFLLNLTNNGWFGESSAQWQHAASAVFRAVENGLPLVRCSNNGLTCWVDARGKLHDVYFPGSKDVYQAGFKIVEVPLGTKRKTIYTAYGDWFGWSCLGLSVMCAGYRVRRSRGSSALSRSV